MCENRKLQPSIDLFIRRLRSAMDRDYLGLPKSPSWSFLGMGRDWFWKRVVMGWCQSWIFLPWSLSCLIGSRGLKGRICLKSEWGCWQPDRPQCGSWAATFHLISSSFQYVVSRFNPQLFSSLKARMWSSNQIFKHCLLSYQGKDSSLHLSPAKSILGKWITHGILLRWRRRALMAGLQGDSG